MSGRFTRETAREAARRPRVDAEPVHRRMFTITRGQHEWLAKHERNASALVRRLLDEHIAREEPDPD